ncbi:hypothetical protein NDU88_002501 [Pleurodeles waltl]|uniref:Uncharacterized protein n=1 Tax=Pleurodeles waltl TaxID=8319 RepID=A0AAV7M0S3_PLEWA|nr:hypothetical protein NDU88_002501 [Pleurodeles waltl]
MTRYCLTQESETACQRYVLKKKQRKNKVTLFTAEQDGAEQYKKRRPEENPLYQMQAERQHLGLFDEASGYQQGVLYGPAGTMAGRKSRHNKLSCSEASYLPSKKKYLRANRGAKCQPEHGPVSVLCSTERQQLSLCALQSDLKDSKRAEAK